MPKFVINELQGLPTVPTARAAAAPARAGHPQPPPRQSQLEVQNLRPRPARVRRQSVDLKLVALAKHLKGRLVTNDYNLNKVASIEGVEVINLNDWPTP